MKAETPRKSNAQQRSIFASLSLFSRRGLDAASVTEIAAEAKENIFFEFFFFIIPFVFFSTYYDDCKKISGLSDKELEETFLRSIRVVLKSMSSGNDIGAPSDGRSSE